MVVGVGEQFKVQFNFLQQKKKIGAAIYGCQLFFLMPYF